MKFYKYQGAGNDFILIDNRNNTFNTNADIISSLCNRRFGIGADGLILVEKSAVADFKMHFFNSDGREADMCGNGARCLVAFAHKLGIFETKTTFESSAGKHFAEILPKNRNTLEVKVKITDVHGITRGNGYYFLNTGVPHCVIFVDNIDKVDVAAEGAKWRHNPIFKDGANVNFVEMCGNNKFRIATFERGVEGETLACGTGATAAAIAANDYTKSNITNFKIETKGGTLGVNFEKDKNVADNYINVWLQGPATFVFEGIVES